MKKMFVSVLVFILFAGCSTKPETIFVVNCRASNTKNNYQFKNTFKFTRSNLVSYEQNETSSFVDSFSAKSMYDLEEQRVGYLDSYEGVTSSVTLVNLSLVLKINIIQKELNYSKDSTDKDYLGYFTMDIPNNSGGSTEKILISKQNKIDYKSWFKVYHQYNAITCSGDLNEID